MQYRQECIKENIYTTKCLGLALWNNNIEVLYRWMTDGRKWWNRNFRCHKHGSNTLFTGHLHQILLHLSLNQRETLTGGKQHLSYFYSYHRLWWQFEWFNTGSTLNMLCIYICLYMYIIDCIKVILQVCVLSAVTLKSVADLHIVWYIMQINTYTDVHANR